MSWLDVGKPESLEKAHFEWSKYILVMSCALIPARGGSKVFQEKILSLSIQNL